MILVSGHHIPVVTKQQYAIGRYDLIHQVIHVDAVVLDQQAVAVPDEDAEAIVEAFELEEVKTTLD